ncbi:MAG: hypothetical protein ACC682_02645 [Gemmatimonadota bacterium]
MTSGLRTAAVFLVGVLVGGVALNNGPSLAVASGPAVSETAVSGAARAAGAIVVQNAYYPNEGMEGEVLRTRLEASAVRAGAGLVVGRVLRRVDGPDDAPFLVWEAEYADAAAREADLAALDDTDFSRVSSHMGTLLAGFGRTVWEVVDRP